MLGFVTDSDWAIRLVTWTGQLVAALVLLLMLQVLLLRTWLIVQNRRERRFLNVWQPLLLQSLESVPSEVPRIGRDNSFAFLHLWNYLHESLLDEAKERLNQTARLAGINRMASQMLKDGSVRERLMAIATIGQLRDQTDWEELQRIAASHHSLLSLTAAHAMIRIDARAAITLLTPLIGSRHDWPAARVAWMLKEAGADVISEPLACAALSAALDHTENKESAEEATRLIRYLEAAHCESAIPVVRRIIHITRDREVIIACLRVFIDSEDLDTVRRFLNDPRWQIRVQAATALGRMGTEEDEARLIALLADEEWWVRYRAAQALCSLPSVTLAKARRIQMGQTNLFARDILEQAIAEQECI